MKLLNTHPPTKKKKKSGKTTSQIEISVDRKLSNLFAFLFIQEGQFDDQTSHLGLVLLIRYSKNGIEEPQPDMGWFFLTNLGSVLAEEILALPLHQ